MGNRQQRKFHSLMDWFEKGGFDYNPREKKNKKNWTKYDSAQAKEISNTLKLIRRMVDEAWEKIDYDEGRGRPAKSPPDKAKALILKGLLGCSDRVFMGFLELFRENLGIKEDLSRKDIERAYDNHYVNLIFSLMVEMTNEPVKDKEENFSIDGTGDSTSVTKQWSNDREKTKERRCYEKIIGVVGNKYKLFSAVEVVSGTANEAPLLKPLLRKMVSLFSNINIFAADAAYLSRENCNLIRDAGGLPRIYPKKNSSLKQRGSLAWKKMLLALMDDPQKWLEEYHIRSISESCYSVYKRRFTGPLTRRKDKRRKREAMIRVLIYNLRQLSYIHVLRDEISVKWLEN